MKKIFFCLIIFIPVIAFAQKKIIIKQLPVNTLQTDTFFLAGGINNWNPADRNFIFKKNKNNEFIVVVDTDKSFEYKIVRNGSWQNVETDLTGNDIENRLFLASDSIQFIEIKNWNNNQNQNIPILHTYCKNVKIIDSAFFMPQLNRWRRIWIYLPPDYYTSNKKYSVLYMHDGQNLFDAATSFSGEWNVDETLDSLYNRGFEVPIVIGIDNGGMNRLNEYSPWKNDQYGGGEGNLYAEFIVKNLKPFIDSVYRVKPDKKHTFTGGSSMGGLISFYLAIQYNTIFGGALVFSPSFWFSDNCYSFISNVKIKNKPDLYFLAGYEESETINVPEQCNRMKKILISNGWGKTNITTKYVKNGKHTESFWRKEFPEALITILKK